MAKYIDADKLIAEIKQQRSLIEGLFLEGDNSFYEGVDNICCHFLEVINSLQQEQEEQPDKGLEEEISRTYHNGSVADTEDIDHVAYENIARHFAEWQKSQMLKDAVEGEVMTNGFYPYEPRIVAPYPNCPYVFGDNVRIVVLKAEEE